MYYIYILFSFSSNLYYVGYTSNYERRFLEHNTLEHNTFTSKHRPWIIKAVFECGNIEAQAMKIEAFIKKQKSSVFIQKIITSNSFTGILAPLVRVPKLRD